MASHCSLAARTRRPTLCARRSSRRRRALTSATRSASVRSRLTTLASQRATLRGGGSAALRRMSTSSDAPAPTPTPPLLSLSSCSCSCSSSLSTLATGQRSRRTQCESNTNTGGAPLRRADADVAGDCLASALPDDDEWRDDELRDADRDCTSRVTSSPAVNTGASGCSSRKSTKSKRRIYENTPSGELAARLTATRHSEQQKRAKTAVLQIECTRCAQQTRAVERLRRVFTCRRAGNPRRSASRCLSVATVSLAASTDTSTSRPLDASTTSMRAESACIVGSSWGRIRGLRARRCRTLSRKVRSIRNAEVGLGSVECKNALSICFRLCLQSEK